MAENDRTEPVGEEADGTRPELVASTLEALQARVEQADREALRGALTYHRPTGSADPDPGEAGE
jgi:hypothetical protein